MTSYELTMLLLEPFFPTLIGRVRGDLRRHCRSFPGDVALLDVGGRKSIYTIGLPARVTVSDILREGETRSKLNLGFTDQIMADVRSKRSNISDVVIDDMTKSSLPSSAYEVIACVEVIEHVVEDRAFIQQVYRVLKPGGILYLTTPNGDYIRNEPPNYNPDHLRHYKRQDLIDLLSECFGPHVKVGYGIKTGKYRYRGLRSFNIRQPLQLAQTMLYNVISHIESRGLDERSSRTAHLFAVTQK